MSDIGILTFILIHAGNRGRIGYSTNHMLRLFGVDAKVTAQWADVDMDAT